MTKIKFKPTGLKRVAALLLCLASLTAIAMPLTAHAEKSQQKVIRVGWYESPPAIRTQAADATAMITYMSRSSPLTPTGHTSMLRAAGRILCTS